MPFSKRTICLPFSILFVLAIIILPAQADDNEIHTPPPPGIAAKAFILQDFNTGKILAENNSDAHLAPASLTKIMTTYVVFRELANGHLHLQDMATISQKAWKTQGSKMFVAVNSQVSIEDLLKGVIIQSGNDASVALAEHVAGNELTFADMMNQHAQRLGMVNSHFENADGLPSPDHYTSARDLAILTAALIREFPDYYRWFSQKEFTYNKITQQNRNMLLSRDDSVDGVKTGHTEDAGFCLVASALRNGMRLISVVMGADTLKARTIENQNLLNYGFRFFESHRIFQGKTPQTEVRVWQGDSTLLPLGLTDDLYVLIPRRQIDKVKTDVKVENPKIMAPVKEGDKFGTVKALLNDEVLAEKDLVALKSVKEGNIFRKLYDRALLMIKKPDAKADAKK
jgi:D-alanyl-D-alanine carboxypeptidase (penicillin-binding protein 5/6)